MIVYLLKFHNPQLIIFNLNYSIQLISFFFSLYLSIHIINIVIFKAFWLYNSNKRHMEGQSSIGDYLITQKLGEGSFGQIF